MKKIQILFLFMAIAQGVISQTVSIPALQTVNYKYHIRGGLVGINLDGSNNPIPNYNEGDLFSYKLEYETASQWNGNVGKQTWARATDLALPCNIDTRSYTFTYDPAQRLTVANYSGTGNYSIPSISYDKNSNINGLQRNGWLGGSHGLIDNLAYGYTGNRLTSVTDGVGGDHTVDLAPKLSGLRTYYEDGSLKSDENKGIINITYDAFTMQAIEISLTGNRLIKMVYLADGTLLKRDYSTSGTVSESWVYTSGMVFLNGQPYSMPIPEGRAVYEAGTWKNEFFITDHLGNVRVTFAEESGKLKEKSINDYDPTGVEHQNSNVSASGFKLDLLKFQDKESLSQSFGLNGLNDFGPRMLDKTLGGIWSQPDILSELNEGASPFSYLNGRLLNMIDPTGMMADSTTRVPGAEASSSAAQTANTKSSEPIPLNQYQVPFGGSGNSGNGSFNLNQAYPKQASNNNYSTPPYKNSFDLMFKTAGLMPGIGTLTGPSAGIISKSNSIWNFVKGLLGNSLVKTGQLNADVAKTFQFGKYSEVILNEPLVLSRYYDGVNAFAKGRFMTNSISRSPILDRIGMAIRPSWNNMTNVAKWEIPAGSKIYKGKAAMQFPWLGGKTQYFIPKDILNASKQIK